VLEMLTPMMARWAAAAGRGKKKDKGRGAYGMGHLVATGCSTKKSMAAVDDMGWLAANWWDSGG
jgi:hypothetical protein